MADSTTTKAATKNLLSGVVDLTPSSPSIGVTQDNSGVFPVPLWKARAVLLEALTLRVEGFFRERGWEGGSFQDDDSRGAGGETATAGCPGPGPHVFFLRLEVAVDTEELGDGQDGPLSWLRAQLQPIPRPAATADDEPTLPRVFLRTPSRGSGDADDDEGEEPDDDQAFSTAGLGAMHLLTGRGRLEDDAWGKASTACPRMRYYGGARFQPLSMSSASNSTSAAAAAAAKRGDRKESSPKWQAYGGHWLVLPLVELSSGGQSGAKGRPQRQPTLAVNLRWTAPTGSSVRGETSGEEIEIGNAAGTSNGIKFGNTDVDEIDNGIKAGGGEREMLTLSSARARAVRTLERIVCRFARPGTEAELPPPLGLSKNGEGRDQVMDTEGEEYRRWERGVERALEDMNNQRYSKVVLARTARLTFASLLSPAEILCRFRDHAGFLFCLQPNANTAFLGCTPERLFLSKGSVVVTEALAGTRRRGDTPAEDQRLGSELMASEKDMRENSITADYISAGLQRVGAVDLHCSKAFLKRLAHVQHICRRITATMPTTAAEEALQQAKTALQENASLPSGKPGHRPTEASTNADPVTAATDGGGGGTGGPSDHRAHAEGGSPSHGQVHEQGGRTEDDVKGVGSGKSRCRRLVGGRALLRETHPTPAVCGDPRDDTYAVIGEIEGFDRGFYAGPVGYISSTCSDFGVAIRSALVETKQQSPPSAAAEAAPPRSPPPPAAAYGAVPIAASQMVLFAGCGIVPGSVASSEWAETGFKLKNFLSLFPERPVRTLRLLPNMNSLWGALVIEELVRLGVRRFCVCPGSRSTPLAVAVARHPSAMATSHHDERGAGFYAVGFARAGTENDGEGVCAVVTTSGTAVANLLPAACEADAAGLPMMLLTADRPAEQRACGSDQTIDQVKLFGSCARLFLDIQCPSDSVHASSLLSDIDHAVWKALGGRGGESGVPGPVHLNFMFRENLAPEGGPVSDAGVPGLSSDWSDRCLESPRICRWAEDVEPFTRTIGSGFHESGSGGLGDPSRLEQVVEELVVARRGLLVLGRLRGPEERCAAQHIALTLRWPVYADVTSGLRCWSAEVGLGVGRLDQILLDDAVRGSLAPDAILQVGSRLISKRMRQFISCPSTALTARIKAICIPSTDWYDPERAFTTRLACPVRELAVAVDRVAQRFSASREGLWRPGSSELLRLVRISEAAERSQTERCFVKVRASAAPLRAESRDDGSVPGDSSGVKKSVPGGDDGHVTISGDAGDVGDGDGDGFNVARESGGVPPRKMGRGRGREEEEEVLTEPFVAWCVSRDVSPLSGLFVSASMPCRDLDSFADSLGTADPPLFDDDADADVGACVASGERVGGARGRGACCGRRIRRVATNRGVNGIDGVMSSAMGYADGLRSPVTLLIGDLATLHDLGSLHALVRGLNNNDDSDDASDCRITVVCVNNSGGGIFSFLPIANPQHADAFTPLLDTPHAVDFGGVCRSMGLEYRRASTPKEFREAFLESQGPSGRGGGRGKRKQFFIEAKTGSREENVRVHRWLGRVGASAGLSNMLEDLRLGWEFTPASYISSKTPMTSEPSSTQDITTTVEGAQKNRRLAKNQKKPTLLLLHGFMGSKADWRGEFTDLATADGHAILNVELPWHGGSRTRSRNSKGTDEGGGYCSWFSWELGGVDLAAEAVGRVCDAVREGPYLAVGYSMGGRVALALAGRRPDLLQGGGGLVMVSANPGLTSSHGRISRWNSDCALASHLASLDEPSPAPPSSGVTVIKGGNDTPSSSSTPCSGAVNEAGAQVPHLPSSSSRVQDFLDRWYAAPLWGSIRSRRPQQYSAMLRRRLDFGLRLRETRSSSGGGRDLARGCLAMSPARQPDMWPLLRSSSCRWSWPFPFPVAYVAGELDCLYGRSDVTSSGSNRSVAEVMAASCPGVKITIVPDCGHAVPTEAPKPLYREVARVARAVTVADPADSRDCALEKEDRCWSPEVKPEVGAPGEPPLRGFPDQEAEAVEMAANAGGTTVCVSDEEKRECLIREVGTGVRITGFHLEDFSVPMTAPLELSLYRLTERRGVLLRLEGEVEEEVSASSACQGRRVWGVGEVTPLPGFHKETLEETARQLKIVAPLLVNSVASFGSAPLNEKIPPAQHQQPQPQPQPLLRLLSPDPPRARRSETAAGVTGDPGDGEIGVVPSAEDDRGRPSTSKGADITGAGEVLLSSLLPSVRCGVEMALVHLVARASGRAIGPALSAACGLPARGSIEVNGLAARGEERLSSGGRDTPRVLKVKVGGRDGPAKDAARTLQLLRDSPRGSTIRLDANQAWTMDEALVFLFSLAEADGATHSEGRQAAAAIEYIEEPLKDPRGLEEFWERSGKVVRYALDESLAMGNGISTDEELLELKGCAAFVIKLSVVGGLARAARLCRLARSIGVTPVLSSAFESGVGLAHATVFASCFSVEGVAHGLSTYTRLDGDIITPGFADVVEADTTTVDVIACQLLLDRIADRKA